MNRKHRRALGQAPRKPDESGAGALFAVATQHHHEGRLAEAETLYRRVLVTHPAHADSLHRLGVIAYQSGRLTDAIRDLGKAIALDGAVAAYHIHRGLALAAVGRLDDAAAACAAAITLDPDSVEAHVNLAVILLRTGRFDGAAESCRRAIALAPALADSHNILGEALLALGRAEDAIASHMRALELAPDYAEAHDNLGQALWRRGHMEEAEAAFRRAIVADTGLVFAYSNLAGVLKTQGRLDDAVMTLRRAISVAPGHAGLLNNLALTLLASGDAQGAMATVLSALDVGETQALRQTFVHCASHLRLLSGGETLRPWLIRALTEGWGRPEDLIRIVLELLRDSPAFGARGFLSAHSEPFDAAPLADDKLLQAVLRATPNVDFDLERALTRTRGILLRKAETGSSLSDMEVDFFAALAVQCFINEYVFPLTADEAGRVRQLGEQLSSAAATGAEIPFAWVLAAGCYRALSSLPDAARLDERQWPSPVRDVLTRQIAEPAEEARLRDQIPRLTSIDPGSLAVREQYEQNPYPRWTTANVAAVPEPLSEHLQTTFPYVGVNLIAQTGLDVLIAGCGTGRNALETHMAFTGARTLAIDLSAASLAYAVRKTHEAGITGIEYGQADLLHIGALGRSFDLIEAMGVLHHMADPFAGWRALLSVLKLGGVMRLGFYSALARRNLPKLDIGEPTAEGLRDARQHLAQRDDTKARQALRAQDFYSLSACRDLLFHTREHRFSLDDLAAFMNAEDLRFIGFAIDDQVLAAYRREFPDDPGGRDLGNWAAYEAKHPDTFAKMYQFWVLKP